MGAGGLDVRCFGLGLGSRDLELVVGCEDVEFLFVQDLGVWYMVYGIWYMVHGIWYMVYGIWYMVYGIWYIVNGISYMVHSIWSMVYGIYCSVQEEVCVPGARCWL